jgi:hypothetical protein
LKEGKVACRIMEERKYVRVAYSVSYSLQGDAEGSYNMM